MHETPIDLTHESHDTPGTHGVAIYRLADEFGITSAVALEVCDVLGIPACTGGSVLTPAQADRWRATAATVEAAATGRSSSAAAMALATLATFGASRLPTSCPQLPMSPVTSADDGNRA